MFVSAASELAAAVTSSRKSPRIRLPTTLPSTSAKHTRIRRVRPAVVNAIRQRTGMRSKRGRRLGLAHFTPRP